MWYMRDEDNRGRECRDVKKKLLEVTDEQNLGRRSPAAAVTAAIALTGVN